ncbi:MAG: hypothetical protein KDD53_11320, partial [Bdellovibrionales bacterium]|nr:hypothetical protein [Bdellovibrionales bacterium]
FKIFHDHFCDGNLDEALQALQSSSDSISLGAVATDFLPPKYRNPYGLRCDWIWVHEIIGFSVHGCGKSLNPRVHLYPLCGSNREAQVRVLLSQLGDRKIECRIEPARSKQASFHKEFYRTTANELLARAHRSRGGFNQGDSI